MSTASRPGGLRILVVSDTTGHMRGGVPAATRHLLDGLTARGHEVGFCSDVALGDGAGVRFFPAHIFEPQRLARQLSDAIDVFEPDVVHLISMSSKALLAATPRLRGRTWVLTCHSIPPYERKLPFFHGSEAAHYALRWLKFVANMMAWRYLFVHGGIPHVIVHSEWVARITQRYGQPAARTTNIPLGFRATAHPVRESPFRGPVGAPRLLTVGGIAHTKGQHDAITAVSQLKQSFPGLRYHIVGEVRDASYLRWLRHQVDRLGLQDNVEILESLAESEKQRLLAAADLYLQPSHEEGFCLAFLEAAFCVPRLVATDAGAMRSICAQDRGARVVAVRDPRGMAAAMAALLSADVPPRLLEDRTQRLAHAFSWEGYTDAHEALYRRLRAGIASKGDG